MTKMEEKRWDGVLTSFGRGLPPSGASTAASRPDLAALGAYLEFGAIELSLPVRLQRPGVSVSKRAIHNGNLQEFSSYCRCFIVHRSHDEDAAAPGAAAAKSS
jgi:hypothetical protein